MRKVFLRAAAAVCVLFAAPALAETAGEPASAALLMQAAQKAKDFAQYRYAYTLDFWTSDGEKEISAKLRFDPRLQEGERWTLLAPAAEDLDKKTRKALKQMQKNDSGDEPILYDGLHEMIDDAELVSDTQTEAVFLAPVDEEDAPRDALEVYITLDKTAGYVSAIELKSKQPFKPAAVAKVNALNQIQRFSAPEEGGPALIATSETQVEGEAMFKSFASTTRQVFSEIERIEMPAEENDG